MAKRKEEMEIIFDDEDIIVISKPANELTIPDRFNKALANVLQELREQFDNVLTVHRLDKETSGVMVFARTKEAHKELNRQFLEKEVDKTYHAIVSGIPDGDELPIDIPLLPHPSKKGQMIPSVRGKESLTYIKVLERFRHATLIEAKPETGRQHQIRVHCSAVGYPLLTDELYGKNNKFYVSSVKKKFNLKKGTEEHPILSRLSLHAYNIEFSHPLTSERINFTSDYPKDFKAALQVLRKYSYMEI